MFIFKDLLFQDRAFYQHNDITWELLAVQQLRPCPPAEPERAAEQCPGDPHSQASWDTARKDPDVLNSSPLL